MVEVEVEVEVDHDPDPVCVGTTGTIGSLMYRELESMRRTATGTRQGTRTDAVSISCARPLASLTGYRLSARKQPPLDSNARPSFCEGTAMPRSSNVDAGRRSTSGRDTARRGFEHTCRAKLGFGRHDCHCHCHCQPMKMDYNYKMLQRRSVSLSEDENATPGRWKNEFRTPMLLRKDGGCRKSSSNEAERGGTGRGGSSMVDVVDLTCNCNANDKMWGTPIASRLRRFSFSRLSQSLN